MGIEHYKLRRERHGIAQEPFCAFLDKLHHRQKEPPQSLKTALWRFDFMNNMCSAYHDTQQKSKCFS